MKSIGSIFGLLTLILGFLFDIYAVSSLGSYLFLVGISILGLCIIIDHKEYTFLLTAKDRDENVAVLLIEKIDKFLIALFFLLGVFILVFSLSYKSTDAFTTLAAEIKRKSTKDIKFGLVVMGETSTKAENNVDGAAHFDFSIFTPESKFRVSADLKKKNMQWVIESYKANPVK
jgi:hypothetical protein